jgi:hypothetical protein
VGKCEGQHHGDVSAAGRVERDDHGGDGLLDLLDGGAAARVQRDDLPAEDLRQLARQAASLTTLNQRVRGSSP